MKNSKYRSKCCAIRECSLMGSYYMAITTNIIKIIVRTDLSIQPAYSIYIYIYNKLLLIIISEFRNDHGKQEAQLFSRLPVYIYIYIYIYTHNLYNYYITC